MAYIIKNLGKKNKGEKLEINWNHKEYILELIKKDDINYSSSKNYNTSVLYIKVTNYKAIVTIPDNGFWQLLVRKKNYRKKPTEVFHRLLVTEED